jgi:hypothetical protein
MKEDFLGNLDKVEPDSQEEADLSQLVVDIQIALVDGAEIVGSPEDASPKKSKKAKKEKVKKEKVKKEKALKEPKPKKEKPPKVFKEKLGGIGMKPMCRELFGEQTIEQIKVAEKEIKDKLAQVYVDAGKGDMAYGLNRADRIFYDIYVEKFGEPPVTKEKAKAVIDSCETTRQLNSADRYIELFNNHFDDYKTYHELKGALRSKRSEIINV